MTIADYIRILFSLIAVLGMIGIFAVLGPRLMARAGTLGGKLSMRKTAPRLKIVETLSLDTKRRLAIIQCDDREHLIILSGQSETVIDSNLPARSTSTADDKEAVPSREAPIFAQLLSDKAA